MFAVSLAGSLFFSISPTEAKDKVLLYLLLTVGPFAVAAPALGPVIDRSRGASRAMVVASAVGRAALCPFLARDIHSLLLFPEAFAMLVLSKVYVVTKGALVPEMAALGMLDETTGTAADGPPMAHRGRRPLNHRSTPVPANLIPHLPMGCRSCTSTTPVPEPTRSSRIWPPSTPASGCWPLFPALSSPSPRWPSSSWAAPTARPVSGVLVAVFAAAAAAGARLPVPYRLGRDRAGRRTGRAGAERPRSGTGSGRRLAPDTDPIWAEDEADLAAFRPIADTEVILALMPMSVLKALVGFTTFLFAFGLRREGAAAWWFGLVLGAFTAGALIGVLLVSRIRRVLNEQQMLTGSLWLVVAATGTGAVYQARWFWAVVALSVGVASAVAKPSFDALVQRHVMRVQPGPGVRPQRDPVPDHVGGRLVRAGGPVAARAGG